MNHLVIHIAKVSKKFFEISISLMSHLTQCYGRCVPRLRAIAFLLQYFESDLNIPRRPTKLLTPAFNTSPIRRMHAC